MTEVEHLRKLNIQLLEILHGSILLLAKPSPERSDELTHLIEMIADTQRNLPA